MINFPGCKINLGLSITEKRKDGFHDIESVMYPIPLCDVLEIVPSKNTFEFQQSGVAISGEPDQNLVVKAYKIIQQQHDIGPVKIHLHKNIPAGAGLGGGSSDCAHTILLLNKLFKLGLQNDKMENYARLLGSDCAFFIQNIPVLATQKGDQFNTIEINLAEYQILIVKPNLHINTTKAYSWIVPGKKKIPLNDIIQLPKINWREELINDFEIPMFSKYPFLTQIKKQIYDIGAVYSSMTGSGSAIYGLFNKSCTLPDNPKFPGCFTWLSKF